MKKLFLVFLMLFVALNFVVAQSENEQEFSVTIWVNIEDDTFRQRVSNEVMQNLQNSEEWNFSIETNPNKSDIHLLINGLKVPGASGYAWSISFTPLFAPKFNNANVATSNATISGMNWVARNTARWLEGQMYIIYDAMRSSEQQVPST